MDYARKKSEATAFHVIDTHDIDAEGNCRVVESYPTHRRALNHCKRLEPKATQGVFRYLVRPVK